MDKSWVLPTGAIFAVLMAMIAGILMHAEPVQAGAAPTAVESVLAR